MSHFVAICPNLRPNLISLRWSVEQCTNRELFPLSELHLVKGQMSWWNTPAVTVTTNLVKNTTTYPPIYCLVLWFFTPHHNSGWQPQRVWWYCSASALYLLVNIFDRIRLVKRLKVHKINCFRIGAFKNLFWKSHFSFLNFCKL